MTHFKVISLGKGQSFWHVNGSILNSNLLMIPLYGKSLINLCTLHQTSKERKVEWLERKKKGGKARGKEGREEGREKGEEEGGEEGRRERKRIKEKETLVFQISIFSEISEFQDHLDPWVSVKSFCNFFSPVNTDF